MARYLPIFLPGVFLFLVEKVIKLMELIKGIQLTCNTLTDFEYSCLPFKQAAFSD
jgi:hypothetical protein